MDWGVDCVFSQVSVGSWCSFMQLLVMVATPMLHMPCPQTAGGRCGELSMTSTMPQPEMEVVVCITVAVQQWVCLPWLQCTGSIVEASGWNGWGTCRGTLLVCVLLVCPLCPRPPVVCPALLRDDMAKGYGN